MFIRDVINKKMNNEELSQEEIKFFIESYQKNEITENQAVALITAMHIYGLSEDEMVHMAVAISETGEELEMYRISHQLTDITSLGGISDKIILMIMSIIHSLKYSTAKVIGRELGMEDRLLAIPNYKLQDNIDDFKLTLNNGEIGILKSVKNLAPIEDEIYKLKRQIGCDHNIQLIAISIMSQKLAIGFQNLFFEITYGDNAYVKTIQEAKKLSKYLLSMGAKLGKNVSCCVTTLEQPVGETFGNAIELKEIYNCLNGEMLKDVMEVVTEFSNRILVVSGFSTDVNKNKKQIKEVISNGEALRSFEMLMGVDAKFLSKEIETKNKIPVSSNAKGYIQEIDVNKLRMLMKYLNAIRETEKDKLDKGAGIVFHKKVGDLVKSSEIIATIYTNDEAKVREAVQRAEEMFKLTDKKVKNVDKIVYEV